MKREKQILWLTMVLNFFIALIKLCSGIVFGFSSLLADSLHSFAEVFTNIIASIASKIGNKRANQRYPFGYGMIDNISNLMIGFILLGLAIFIFIEALHPKTFLVKPTIFLVLLVVLCLKSLVVWLLYTQGKKLKSNTLMMFFKESSMDFLSTFIVLLVSICMLLKDKIPIFQYADALGSIAISLLVLHLAFKIIVENIEYLLGKNDENHEIMQCLFDILKKYSEIKEHHLKLVKFGYYYSLYITISLDTNVSLKKLFRLENNIKKDIRKHKLKIKFIQIEPQEYKERKA